MDREQEEGNETQVTDVRRWRQTGPRNRDSRRRGDRSVRDRDRDRDRDREKPHCC